MNRVSRTRIGSGALRTPRTATNRAGPSELANRVMNKRFPMAMVLCAALFPGFAGCTHKAEINKDLEKAARDMEKADAAQASAPAPAQPAPPTQPSQTVQAPAPATQPPPAQQMNQALAAY